MKKVMSIVKFYKLMRSDLTNDRLYKLQVVVVLGREERGV